MEDYSYINENFSSYIPPMKEHVISGIVYSLISVLGMIGNGCVILAVIYVRTLQTTTNVFIVNLAVADFLASSLLPLYTVSFWTDNFFPSLDILCALTTGLLRACLAASSFNLASIGINRLLIVIQAKSIYKVLFSPKSMTIWIICLWVCALSLSYVPHFMGIGRIGYTIRPHQCGIIPANPGTKTAHTILTLGMYPIPFCIIVVCYSWIYCYVYRHNARMMKYEIEKPNATSPTTISSTDPASSSTNLAPKKANRVSSVQIQITKNLFYILCAFVICLSPQMICSFLGCVNLFTKTFVTVNSMVNPFIYGANHPHFRRVFMDFLNRLRGKLSTGLDSENVDSSSTTNQRVSTNLSSNSTNM